MNAALEALLRDGPPDAAAIDEFLGRHAFPLVDPDSVTFVYRGEHEAVNLRNWIYGLAASQPFQRAEGTDLWHLTFTLPENSRIEYKFELINDGHHEWIVDPLNAATATDPYGANSVCQGYGYERPSWTVHNESARHGTIRRLRLHSQVFGEDRNVGVYLPARFREGGHYPLLIVHDGDDFLRFADLKVVLDNLIHELAIPPLVVALTQTSNRLTEYAGDDRHARHLAEELLPVLKEKLPLIDDPDSRGLMGASFGAVASLHAAWRYPGLFGRLLLESGSFAFSDIGLHKRGPVFDPVVEFMNAFRKEPGAPAGRLYVACGIYESLIYENRSLIPLLQTQGLRVRYEEVRDGHNWQNWRDRLYTGLTWLFPGPSWMVYE